MIFLPLPSKLLAVKVLFYLHLYGTIHRIMPFRCLSVSLGKQTAFDKQHLNQEQLRFVFFLQRIFLGLNKYWFLKFKCLTKSLAAARILRNRNIPYILYLGVTKDKSIMKAHSWIKCEEVDVAGIAQGVYTSLTYFVFAGNNKMK